MVWYHAESRPRDRVLYLLATYCVKSLLNSRIRTIVSKVTMKEAMLPRSTMYSR